jgi:hypothetical protein
MASNVVHKIHEKIEDNSRKDRGRAYICVFHRWVYWSKEEEKEEADGFKCSTYNSGEDRGRAYRRVLHKWDYWIVIFDLF